jgi:hypothetical protein
MISLVIRPPADHRAVAWRLAIGLALMFTLNQDQILNIRLKT